MNAPKIPSDSVSLRECAGCKEGVMVLILHSDTSILQREIPCDESHDSLPFGPLRMYVQQPGGDWYTFRFIGGFGWILELIFLGYFAYTIAGFLYPLALWRLSRKIRRSKKHLISSTRTAQVGNSVGSSASPGSGSAAVFEWAWAAAI